MELPDYLPLSLLNQVAYCPRRFWLMFCQNEIVINAPMLDGILRHQHAHTPGIQPDKDGDTFRSVYVWSNTWRIAGIADFVQEKDGHLIPREHKRGRMGKWVSDHVQLCAQAMCLEERTGDDIPYGEIFYWSNRRREHVPFDESLRATTIQTIEQAFNLLKAGKLPAPIDHPARCRDCSLEPVCLPHETLMLLQEEETS